MDYHRQPNESAKAHAALMIYCELGANRSLEKVHQKCGKHTRLLARWSSQWSWVARAAFYDAEQEQIKQAARQAEIEKIMSEGFANVHERVKTLNRLGRKLYREIQNPELLWLPDVKQIGSGEFAQRVDLIRFNSGLVSEFRGVLDDIAKETGGRIRKSETKITTLPKQYIGFEDLEAAHDLADQQEELEKGD